MKDKNLRSVTKPFRFTPEEIKRLDQDAMCHNLDVSKYVRMMLFDPSIRNIDPEISRQLQNLNWEINKVGTNINQIVRSCNSKKFVTKADIENLIKYQNLISYQLQQICDMFHNPRKGDG